MSCVNLPPSREYQWASMPEGENLGDALAIDITSQGDLHESTGDDLEKMTTRLFEENAYNEAALKLQPLVFKQIEPRFYYGTQYFKYHHWSLRQFTLNISLMDDIQKRCTLPNTSYFYRDKKETFQDFVKSSYVFNLKSKNSRQ